MQEVITINADGSIGGCPNTSIEHAYASIDDSAKTIADNRQKAALVKTEQTKSISCYSCDLYQVCNGDCHQLSWQNDLCPAPKQLIRRIQHDLARKKKISLCDA